MGERTLIACSVGYASGGLGQHFAQVVEEARARGALAGYLTPRIKPGDEAIGQVVRDRLGRYLIRYTPIRFDPGAINHLENERFDRAVARRLGPLDASSFTGFGGQSLRSFGRARELGCGRLGLIAANSHVNNVARRHADALRLLPVERSWLNEAQRAKTLREYEMADEICIASDYTRETFLREGVPESKLRRIRYLTHPRFAPPAEPRVPDGVFRVVYTGSITVMKGVPLLLDAFARLPIKEAELTLVGGTGTRGMRKYLAAALARDPRVRLAPGDPLPHLRRADVCVHPSWEDNLAYAPLEAMACGVPVVVSADTGMKEYVREGVNGYVVPTGDADAIFERLTALARAPMPVPRPVPSFA